MIIPTVVYGIETWILNKANRERRVLREIFGGRRVEFDIYFV